MFVLSSAGTGGYPIAAHRPVRSSSHLALLVMMEGEAVARERSCRQRYQGHDPEIEGVVVDTVAVRRGRGPRVPVGLPSGDAYTVLLRMFGDREYRRQRGGASVSAAVGMHTLWRRL